ncbi:unnamed protein product [Mytilus edulis]|uniref:Uncharacterized protein n=1 Tax=Mytilus edulis TaxID=6550 RepID=A0A8S3RNN4_MYTED|nr:unnamed protein product [Mytilus edulis]
MILFSRTVNGINSCHLYFTNFVRLCRRFKCRPRQNQNDDICVALIAYNCNFSEDKFNEICVSPNIDLRSYVKYITGIIKDVTKPNLTKLENTCWELCQEMYSSPSLLCGEIKSLWSIFIRLADDETCPPTLTNQNYFIIYSLFDLSSTQREKQPKTKRNKTSFPCTERWEGFTNFKRTNKDGKTVMISRSRILGDIEPGIHNLRDLMPIIGLPSLKPKHTVVKNIKWISKELPESTHSSGKLIFPPSFDEHIVTENATSEFLAYYGCRFADMSFETVTLPFRHCIQDFNYKKDYLEEFVLNSGAGIEKHNFLHLDCPLEDDSGFFILGEIYNEDEIHLTAFKIPLRHTLYVPRGCIHSNDYLKGTWRTMLSDESDIDHVFLVKKSRERVHQFHFKFK